MDKIYKVKKIDGTFFEMQYDDVCKSLGFVANVRFVEITNHGTISFTVGKPNEVKALLASCQRCGYVPSGKLVQTARM